MPPHRYLGHSRSKRKMRFGEQTCRSSTVGLLAARSSASSALIVSLCHARTKRAAFCLGQSLALRPLDMEPAFSSMALASSSLLRASRVDSARRFAFRERYPSRSVCVFAMGYSKDESKRRRSVVQGKRRRRIALTGEGVRLLTYWCNGMYLDRRTGAILFVHNVP